jgi:S-adenosylmethionine decarboxylase
MIVGTEWLIDAAGCRPESLCDLKTLRRLFDRIVAELNLQLAGEAQWRQFPPPGGITGLVLLSESHLACHTYPEYGIATLNLYCCRARPAWPWAERLYEILGATDVRVSSVDRSTTEARPEEGGLCENAAMAVNL